MIMHHIRWQKNFWDRLHWPRSKIILSEQCLSHGQGQIQFWHLTLWHWTLQIVRTLSFCLSQDLSQLWQIHHQEFVTEKKKITNYSRGIYLFWFWVGVALAFSSKVDGWGRRSPLNLTLKKLPTISSRDFHYVKHKIDHYWIDPNKDFCPKSFYTRDWCKKKLD